jgi:hypothetical protein
MEPELTLPDLQRIFEQFAVSAYADPAISQSLYDSWSTTLQDMTDHLRHEAKMNIAYFDYDEDTYTLQTEAARLPEWFRPDQLYKGDLIAIFNPETGRTVTFEFVCKHIGPVHSRIVFQSAMPLRQVTDRGSEFLRVIIEY